MWILVHTTSFQPQLQHLQQDIADVYWQHSRQKGTLTLGGYEGSLEELPFSDDYEHQEMTELEEV